MRVLLVNPAMDLRTLGRFRGLMEPMPVLGLASLAAVTEAAGHHVQVVDQFAANATVEDVVAQALAGHPDVVGLGMLTPAAPLVLAIARGVKEVAPDVRVVIGNIHADVFWEELLRRPEIDYVVHGEGEETFISLLDAIGGGSPGDERLAAIPGLSFRDASGEPRKGVGRPTITDLDSLPVPAWHLFPFQRYGLLPLGDIARPTLAMAASRGCPYRCEFCSLLHQGSSYRRREPKAIVDEYEAIHRRYGARQIGFVDPIFPLNKTVMVDFCEELMRRGLQREVVWISETRVDRVDRESLRVMRASGCRRLLFGIESGVDLLLENVNKTFTTATVRKAVKLCHEEGIESVGLFMIGLPGETEEMTVQTIDFACSLDLDFAKFAITVPFPGSQLFEDLRREGRLDRHDWENFSTFQPDPARLPFIPREVSNEALVRLQKTATRRFYLRPGMIKHHLFDVRTIGPRQILRGLRGVLG